MKHKLHSLRIHLRVLICSLRTLPNASATSSPSSNTLCAIVRIVRNDKEAIENRVLVSRAFSYVTKGAFGVREIHVFREIFRDLAVRSARNAKFRVGFRAIARNSRSVSHRYFPRWRRP